jgi:hypothetical protein
VHDASPAVVAKLNELKQTFSGSDLHECPAGDK